MKKNTLFSNLIFTIIWIVFYILFSIYSELKIQVFLGFLSFILFVFMYKIKLKTLKSILYSVEFWFGFCFWCYSIVGSIVFIMDDYSPRFYYFDITKKSMETLLNIHLKSFSIFNILCVFFNRIKCYEIKEQFNRILKTASSWVKSINIFDGIALVVVCNSLMNIFSNISIFFNLSVSARRQILNSGISHYINIYMVMYSVMMLFVWITSKQNNNNIKSGANRFRIILMAIFWIIFLTCERRLFLSLLISVIIIFYQFIKKIKLKQFILIAIIVVVLLFSASFRANINFKTHSAGDVIYMSLTEFYCTFSIGNYYLNNSYELQNGKTYVVNSLESLLPRFIYSNKSEDLAKQFKEQAGTNVGFAYTPVAEGLLNFGKLAVYFVPVIMLFVTMIIRKVAKDNIVLYAIYCSFAIDYCRGEFSNFFFDCLLCYVIYILIYKVKWNRGM